MQKRKELGLNQAELSNGICGQYIISKIEKHSIAPSLSVLLKLVKRLDITLNDVFSEFSDQPHTDSYVVLRELENQAFGAKDLASIKEGLSVISVDDLTVRDQTVYYFLNGYFNLTDNPMNTQFDTDTVLRLTKSDTYNVYTDLAYLLKGQVAEKHKDYIHAKEYYKIVENAIQANLLIPNANEKQVLFMLVTLSNFYINQEEWEHVVVLCNRAIDFAAKSDSRLFNDIIYFNLALSQKKLGQDNTEAKLFAQVFAKVAVNHKVLQKADVEL